MNNKDKLYFVLLLGITMASGLGILFADEFNSRIYTLLFGGCIVCWGLHLN